MTCGSLLQGPIWQITCSLKALETIAGQKKKKWHVKQAKASCEFQRAPAKSTSKGFLEICRLSEKRPDESNQIS